MKRGVILASMLLPLAALAQGEIVVQPQASGNLRLHAEGGSSGTPSGMLSVDQPAGKQMTLQVLSTAPGGCSGGDITLDSIRVPVRLLSNNQKVMCGDVIALTAPAQTRQVVLNIEKTPLGNQTDSLARNPYGSRVQVGAINYQVQGESMESTPVYVDFTLLHQTLPSLTATFDNPALDFGQVGELRDAIASTRLHVSKTVHAGEEALPYDVTFESKQLKENKYRLRASVGESLIPYGIFIEGQEVAPGDPYHSLVPAGVATSDILNIEFHLPGKAIRGMAAGARLLDTVTAVITPES